jgi:hypothetical protein
LQDALVKDLCHEAEVLVDDHRVAVRYRNASRLLPAMLERIERVIDEAGDVNRQRGRGVDGDDAARIPGFAAHPGSGVRVGR